MLNMNNLQSEASVLSSNLENEQGLNLFENPASTFTKKGFSDILSQINQFNVFDKGMIDSEISDVLVAQDLEASGLSFFGYEARPGEEEAPESEPPITVGLHDGVFVGQPVVVPLLECDRVVVADVFDRMDFESGGFEVVGNPGQLPCSIGPREDVFGHEETKSEVFFAAIDLGARHLQEEKSIVFQRVIELMHVGAEIL